MRRLIPAFITGIVIFFGSASIVMAESSYVLPYPSNMPGSKWYLVDTLQERVLKYWYFGEFSSFTFNLRYSDKYLVEAKTLFEYNQYLLAVDAIQKSDSYFQKLEDNLLQAEKNGRDISEKSSILIQAAEKHREVIDSLVESTPTTFNWTPEKDPSTQLHIHQILNNSNKIRSI